jgi:hypothetical protein
LPSPNTTSRCTIAIGCADHAEALHHLEFQRIQRQLQAAIGQGGAGGQDLLDRRVFDHVAPDHPGRFRLPVQAQQTAPVGAIAGIEHGRRERRAASGLQPRQQRRLRTRVWMAKSLAIASLPDRGFIADIDRATRRAQARTGARRDSCRSLA